MAQAQRVEREIEEWTQSYCPYCGVGCGLLVGTHRGRVARIKGDPTHPSSLGDICLKPIHLPDALYSEDRLLFPQMRFSQDTPFRRTGWDQAITHVASVFQRIIAEHGPQAIAFYGSGQCTTEDYYVANKLMKGFIGANNFDANSRLCMASAVAGYVTALGSDGPPPAYADIELADCFFLIGANTADCHPVLFNRIKRRKQRDPDGVKVIVVDPRTTRTASIADIHLAIRPGSDIALLNGMLYVLIKSGYLHREFIANHTSRFAEAAAIVEAYPPHVAAALCDVPVDRLVEAALVFGKAERALSFWSMGINQSTVGVTKNHAILNLHLATGQLGKPGSGPFSLTGQPNAMGGREAGGLSHLLPGYRSVQNPVHRAEVARFWGVPADSISARPGLPAVELFEAAARGEVKAIWIMGTNPLVSMPNTDVVEAAMRRLKVVVVSDAYHPTDTTQYAHVLLPAAQWSEKEGIMTNSERRITYLPKLVDPPGEALPDWQIVTRVARTMGYRHAFPYRSAQEVFDEFKQLTQGRVCDYAGVSYRRLQEEGPLQWPAPAVDHPGTERLYTDLRFHTPDGRASFVPAAHQTIYEPPDAAYPLILMTGRVKNQWHTMTRTGKSWSLLKDCPEPYLELHPSDAQRWNIDDGELVQVISRRGKVVVPARVSTKIRPGTCFMPFHWGRTAGQDKAANNVTIGAVDPVSREPELKACAVRVCPATQTEVVTADQPALTATIDLVAS
ncbi:MAG TPA: nitrate reductase [Caldilineaceae bacterium]|nr:nitrate reductase [Caldilineaceae bacterium]